MTDDTIHTCSYSCERPECIRAQRDELVAKVEALRAEVERLRRLVQERDTMLGKRLCAGTNADGKPRCLALAEERARAERLAEALRESHSEVLRLRAAMFRVYATAANGGNPTMYIEQMRDEMDKPWSGDKASAALEQESGRG